MVFSPYVIRIIANTCIERYDRGEGTIIEIVDSYPLSPEDRELVLQTIYTKRPELQV